MNPSEDQLESNSLFDQSIVYTHSDERLLSRPKHLQSRISNIISKPMDKDTHHDHDDGDSKKVSKKMAPLPDDFRPGENDVICGRGRNIWNSVGNVRFRSIVESRVDEYSTAKTKLDKSKILSSIVAEIRRLSPHGGFVKKDSKTKKWFEVGDFLAREKVSQSFRDVLHDRYRSSNKTKKKRRLEEQEKTAFVNSAMQKIALEQIQSGKTDKNLYEIICQQQSLLEESGNLPQHSSTMREDSIGGGLVSKPDSRLSNVNVTAPYPPSSATDTNFASMQYYQNDFGTLTHPGTPVAPAGGIASQHQMHSAAPRDFMSMQNQPQQQPRQAQQPIFEHPQTLPTALDTFMVDQTLRRPSLPGVQQMFSEATPTVNTRASLQSSWSQLQPPPQQAQPNFAMAMPFSGTNQVAPLAPVQLSELAQSLAATIRQPNQEGPVDNPFEPVPLPEGNQAGINVNGAELQSLPDDIDNIFDDT